MPHARQFVVFPVKMLPKKFSLPQFISAKLISSQLTHVAQLVSESGHHLSVSDIERRRSLVSILASKLASDHLILLVRCFSRSTIIQYVSRSFRYVPRMSVCGINDSVHFIRFVTSPVSGIFILNAFRYITTFSIPSQVLKLTCSTLSFSPQDALYCQYRKF